MPCGEPNSTAAAPLPAIPSKQRTGAAPGLALSHSGSPPLNAHKPSARAALSPLPLGYAARAGAARLASHRLPAPAERGAGNATGILTRWPPLPPLHLASRASPRAPSRGGAPSAKFLSPSLARTHVSVRHAVAAWDGLRPEAATPAQPAPSAWPASPRQHDNRKAAAPASLFAKPRAGRPAGACNNPRYGPLRVGATAAVAAVAAGGGESAVAASLKAQGKGLGVTRGALPAEAGVPWEHRGGNGDRGSTPVEQPYVSPANGQAGQPVAAAAVVYPAPSNPVPCPRTLNLTQGMAARRYARPHGRRRWAWLRALFCLGGGSKPAAEADDHESHACGPPEAWGTQTGAVACPKQGLGTTCVETLAAEPALAAQATPASLAAASETGLGLDSSGGRPHERVEHQPGGGGMGAQSQGAAPASPAADPAAAAAGRLCGSLEGAQQPLFAGLRSDEATRPAGA